VLSSKFKLIWWPVYFFASKAKKEFYVNNKRQNDWFVVVHSEVRDVYDLSGLQSNDIDKGNEQLSKEINDNDLIRPEANDNDDIIEVQINMEDIPQSNIPQNDEDCDTWDERRKTTFVFLLLMMLLLILFKVCMDNFRSFCFHWRGGNHYVSLYWGVWLIFWLLYLLVIGNKSNQQKEPFTIWGFTLYGNHESSEGNSWDGMFLCITCISIFN